MYDYEDFYNEPSEFEQQVDEFKQSLLNAVKDEYKSEMDRLREENADLQEIKRNFTSIKQEYALKERQLEKEKRNLKDVVRRERLTEIMSNFQVELFRPDYHYKNEDGCEKCGGEGVIRFVSPSGKKMSEYCSCKDKIKYFEPEMVLCSSFESRNGKFIAWYKPYSDTDGMEYDRSSNVPSLIYNGEKYEALEEKYKTWEVYFKTEEECQAYCDWLSEHKGESK